jgi:hypothetical protein
MKRIIVAGGVAIALFMVASLYLVDQVFGPAPARGGPTAGAPGGDGSAAPGAGGQFAAAQGTELPAGLAGVGVPKAQVEVDPAPPPPPRGSWEAVPISARAASMGPAGVAVGRELNDLHGELGACFDEDAQARNGTAAVSAVRDTATLADVGSPVLVLQLETLSQSVRIVDAPVETRGGASDGLLACAQRKLRGLVVQAPGVQGGQRHRLQFALQQ